jgi:hypothetical protein
MCENINESCALLRINISENRDYPAMFNENLAHRIVRISVSRLDLHIKSYTVGQTWPPQRAILLFCSERPITEYLETESEISTTTACSCRTQQFSSDSGWQVCTYDAHVSKLRGNTRLSKTASVSPEGYRSNSAKLSMTSPIHIPSISPHLTI